MINQHENQMASTDSMLPPLVQIAPVANMQNAWVALGLQIQPVVGELADSLYSVFGSPDLLAAVAPLDCIVMLDSPLVITDALAALMPAARVILAVDAAAVQNEAATKRLLALQDKGYRILIDGVPPAGVTIPATLRGVARDFSQAAPGPDVLQLVFGPHLAYGVNTAARVMECAHVGFEWFSGDYPLHPAPNTEPHDGTSRKRLMTMLGLLARDAETRELEALLKQDPALSYHLLKLANSAMFAHTSTITSFSQAISVLGRRQLQRWLQLLLYARQDADGMANPLLPIAALRAAQMESLCKLRGGEREEQDLAFMTGVFSLLDLLFAMPMDEIVGALSLPPIAANALLKREGPFGELLSLVEAGAIDASMLDRAGLAPEPWWRSQLHAYHWAIQVNRNL
jgi:EAL and modified HD-GYP domain-containing signal transduction protein